MLTTLITQAEALILTLIKKAHKIEFYQGGDSKSCWLTIFQLRQIVDFVNEEGIEEDAKIQSKLVCLIDKAS